MIDGFFDKEGRPHVRARLYFPRLRLRMRLRLLVDTGADQTLMGAADSWRIPVDQLDGPTEKLEGIGGKAVCYFESAILGFRDGSLIRTYPLDIGVVALSKQTRGLPSILGQDILNNWRITHDRSVGYLKFNVRNAHDSFRFSPQSSILSRLIGWKRYSR